MSVTILQPVGSTPADVAAEIARISAVSDARPAGPSSSESDAVASLLTYLEDRRLLTDETGYQSHFPDHLRQSAADIRERTTAALTKISRTSSLAPALKQLREAARNFQQATEGAMDGHRAGGGMTPHVPMGFPAYFEALALYRYEIYQAMKAVAKSCGLELDPRFQAATEQGHSNLLSLARSFRSRGSSDA